MRIYSGSRSNKGSGTRSGPGHIHACADQYACIHTSTVNPRTGRGSKRPPRFYSAIEKNTPSSVKLWRELSNLNGEMH